MSKPNYQAKKDVEAVIEIDTDKLRDSKTAQDTKTEIDTKQEDDRIKAVQALFKDDTLTPSKWLKLSLAQLNKLTPDSIRKIISWLPGEDLIKLIRLNRAHKNFLKPIIDRDTTAQEIIRNFAATAKNLSEVQRAHLGSLHLQLEIAKRKTTVHQAIVNTVPDITSRFAVDQYQDDCRLAGIRAGLTPAQVRNAWFSALHLDLIKQYDERLQKELESARTLKKAQLKRAISSESLPGDEKEVDEKNNSTPFVFSYENVQGLENHQLQGLKLGLTRNQVRYSSFSAQHLGYIKKELGDKNDVKRAQELYSIIKDFSFEHFNALCYGFTAEQLQGLSGIGIHLLSAGADKQTILKCQSFFNSHDMGVVEAFKDGYKLEELSGITSFVYTLYKKIHDQFPTIMLTDFKKLNIDSYVAQELVLAKVNIQSPEEVQLLKLLQQHHIPLLKAGLSIADAVKSKGDAPLSATHLRMIKDGYKLEDISDLYEQQLQMMERCSLTVPDLKSLGKNNGKYHHIERLLGNGHKFSDLANLSYKQLIGLTEHNLTLAQVTQKSFSQDIPGLLELGFTLKQLNGVKPFQLRALSFLQEESDVFALILSKLEKVKQTWFTPTHTLALVAGITFAEIEGKSSKVVAEMMHSNMPNSEVICFSEPEKPTALLLSVKPDDKVIGGNSASNTAAASIGSSIISSNVPKADSKDQNDSFKL